MIRLLLVEDSPVQSELLQFLIEEDGGFEIVGVAEDGEKGAEMVPRLRPDIVLMDFHMPRMNGAEATRRIMETCPVPVVITSASMVADDVAPAFDAVGTGALALLPKPIDMDDPDHERQTAELLRTLRLMSEVKVVRRWAPRSKDPMIARVVPEVQPEYNLVAIGGSTGAPAVLAEILGHLPPDFALPVIIVQHMARGFAPGFAQWLDAKSPLKVKVAVHGEKLVGGAAWLAPDDMQIGIDRARRVVLRDDVAENGFRPSVDAMFHSVARVQGSSAIGVILTGMGRDGVAGLKAIRDAGGLTVAQDEKSCVIFGMPHEAIRSDAVDQVRTPRGIANLILESVSGREAHHHV